jgi:hypothetical protein
MNILTTRSQTLRLETEQRSRFMHRFFTPALAAAAILAVVPHAEAGFREQTNWQFRSPAELQVELNREALRQQLNGQQAAGVGGTAIGLGAPEVAGSTVGNQTSGTTSYTVNLNGSGNSVTIDGYLNLSTSQQSEGQSASVTRQGTTGK